MEQCISKGQEHQSNSYDYFSGTKKRRIDERNEDVMTIVA
jgi:hypothetical protein